MNFTERQNKFNEIRKSILAESITDNKIPYNRENETRFSKSLFETLYEGFDEETFINKVKMDDYLYSEITKKIPEEYKDVIESKLEELVLISRDLYESLDIKPKSFYFNESDNYKSIQENEEKATNVITKWLDREYFNLNESQIEKKYYQKSTDLVSLLNEDTALLEGFREDNVPENEMVDKLFEHSMNSLIYKELLTSVIIPSVVQTRIDQIISESEFTNDIIDFETISESYDLLKNKIFETSRLIVALSELSTAQ